MQFNPLRDQMKRVFCLIVVLALGPAVFGQSDTVYLKKRVRASADSLAKGFVKKDWELFTRYSYPALIGSLGGKDAFISMVRSRLGGIPDSAWKRYEPGEVLQLVKTERDWQALVELHSVLEWAGMRISTTHFLIAESWNGGQDWTFFDSQNSRDIAILIKPDLSPLIEIPAAREKAEALDK